MGQTAYFDCISGISGDMTLGALVDLGVDVKSIESAVRSMGLPERIDLHCNRDTLICLFNAAMLVEENTGTQYIQRQHRIPTCQSARVVGNGINTSPNTVGNIWNFKS